MLKRVALTAMTLFGLTLALQPAVASAQDRYYEHGDRGYRHDYDRDRGGRDRDWRNEQRHEHEWRESREWRDRDAYRSYRPGYYGGSYYYQSGAPAYGYGYAAPCR